MDVMRKVPDAPKDLRSWFFKRSAGEDYMFRDRNTKEYTCTNCGEASTAAEIQRQDGGKKIRHNDMEYSESWIYELHGRALKKIQIN